MNEYIALPDAPAKKVVFACHGSGRCAVSYRDVPFYARQKEIALACGCAFAAVDMGPDTYGTPKGLEILEGFYARIVEEYGFDKSAAFWASSAGGCAMFNFAARNPECVALMLGIFPVWDLKSVTHLKSMRAAWHLNEGELPPDEYNPACRLAELPNVPIVIAQGTNDKAVPPEKNSMALKSALGDRVTLFMTADEHSTEAFGLYETDIFEKALKAYNR